MSPAVMKGKEPSLRCYEVVWRKTDPFNKTQIIGGVSRSPATTLRGLQSSLAEIREPVQTSTLLQLITDPASEGVARRKLFLRKPMLESLRAFGKRFCGLGN